MPPKKGASSAFKPPLPTTAPTAASSLNASNNSTTPTAELTYTHSKHTIALLQRDEGFRQLHLRNLILADDVADLQSELASASRRADASHSESLEWQDAHGDLVEARDYLQEQLAGVQSQLKQAEAKGRTREKEKETLRAQLENLSAQHTDSSTLLTEKLSLQREVAALKPELEHYRSQHTANEGLLGDKLGLQRKLAERDAEVADLREQVDTVKSEVVREQKARVKAEKAGNRKGDEEAAAKRKECEELAEELAAVKRENERLSKVVKSAEKGGAEIATLTQELEDAKAEIKEIKAQLAAERKDRAKIAKEQQKAITDVEAQKALLDEKLDQFRMKLRSTKESLKETQEELQRAREVAAAAPKPTATAKNPKKRVADPDAAIGTPGDAGPAAKRNKRASSVIGEKSTFSITPLLNRTRGVSLVPEGQAPDQSKAQKPKKQAERSIADETEQPAEQPRPFDPDEPVASIEPGSVLGSPMTSRETSAVPPASDKPQPLAPASPSKSNLKAKPAAGTAAQAARKKAAKASKLEMVTEEVDTDDENAQPTQPKQPATAAAKPRLSLKPRSLSTFQSFRDGSLQPRESSLAPQIKKKRKLLGAAAKTIFDEDEEEEAAPRVRAGSVALGGGGQRAFGAFGASGFGKMGGLIGKKKGPLVLAKDGFMFSPLKKDRRAMAEAARAASEAA